MYIKERLGYRRRVAMVEVGLSQSGTGQSSQVRHKSVLCTWSEKSLSPAHFPALYLEILPAMTPPLSNCLRGPMDKAPAS